MRLRWLVWWCRTWRRLRERMGRAWWRGVQEVAADATVGLGGRLLRRLLGREESAPMVEAAVMDVAEDPADEDRLAALRLQIRKAVVADAQLAAELSQLLVSAGVTVTASGERSVAGQTISGVVITGDGGQVTR